jgi:hypothetical protein
MTFNAYHKWLGIPPEEQPPNHYRLLGIKVFETDPDVIASAADRQMAHIRTFQSGLHSAESQRVLNEISTARVALLNSAKKAEYDRQLQQLGAPSKPAPQETADLDFLNAPAAPGAMPAAGPKPTRSGSKPQAWIGLAVLGALVVLAGIWAVNLGRNKNEVASVEPKSPAADRATGEPAGTEPKRKPELPPPPPPPKPQPQDAPKPKPEPKPEQKPKPEPISPAPLVAPKTPEEESKSSQENESIRWPGLTRLLNDMSHWHVAAGNWRSENGRIVGSDDCVLVFNHHLPDDFVLELTINVIEGMRPRVHLPGFHVGNEGYSKTISLFDVDDAVGHDFPYDNKQTMRLRIVAGDNVQLYINGALVKEGKRRAARAGDLRISGGDFWSRGTTAFSDFTLGSSQDEASPVSEPKAPAKAGGETVVEATNQRWIELLKEVNLDKDRIEGKWKREGDFLRAAPDAPSSVPLPVTLSGSYDLQVEFTRNTGTGSIQMELPVRSSLCTLALGGWNDAASVLAAIDGQETPPEATRRPGTLVDGKRYTVLAQIRVNGEAASVEILLDGQPYLQWKGKESQISVPEWAHPPYRDHPALGGGYCDVTYRSAKVRVISGKAPLVSGPKAEETSAAAKAAGETAAEATTHKTPAKHSAARLISSLKKKLRGKLVYDARTEQFTLTYDWASKQQLQDFDLSKAKLPFVRCRLALQGGESIRHAVDFKEVTIGALVFVPAMKGTLIRTSGGLQARVGGQWPDTMYLDGGGGDNPSLVVPDSQRKGIQPIVVTITETHLGFAYGSGNPSQLGKAVTDFHAGQVELSGGDVGFQYGKLVLTGLIDDKWLRSYVEE